MAFIPSSPIPENVSGTVTTLDIQEFIVLKTSAGWADGSITHTCFAVYGMGIPADNGLGYLLTFDKNVIDYMRDVFDKKNAKCERDKLGFTYAIVAVFWGCKNSNAGKELAFLLKKFKCD